MNTPLETFLAREPKAAARIEHALKDINHALSDFKHSCRDLKHLDEDLGFVIALARKAGVKVSLAEARATVAAQARS